MIIQPERDDMMKKILSLILVFIFIASCFTVSSAALKDDSLGIAVASDLHYNQPREKLEGDIDDEVYFYANRRAAMEDESGFIIDEFLAQCAENDDVDYVLIAGDLADNGRIIRQEHLDVAAKLGAFEKETGKKVYVINGNHDTGRAEDDFKNEDFRQVYADFGFSEALETQEGTLSYTADLGEKYRLIAADSCDPSKSTEDGLTSDRVDWIVSQAKKAYDDGRYPVLMMHHNLLPHMPLQRILSHNFIVRNHTVTASKLADAGIKIVLTGHEHGSDVMSYTSAAGNIITDFSNTSLTMYPLAYRYMEFSGDKITYSEKFIDKIDFDALTQAVDGYTDKQLTPMKEGLNEYAKGFFKAGIRYRLWLSLTPEKLGVAEDAFYSDLVYTAVNGLVDILDMPLYGEGGLKEKAAEYGIDLPDSDYFNGWDVATEVVSYHYAGCEPFALDSTEVTLILKIADFLLLDDLSTVNDRVFLGAANKILSNLGTDSVCKDFTKAAAKTFGPVTAGEYFILSIASPLLYGLAYDRDDLDDNNGEIPGYEADYSNAEAISENVSGFFEKMFLYLSISFRYFTRIFTKFFIR